MFLVYKGMALQINVALAVGIYFMIFGALMLIGEYFLDDLTSMKLIGIGLGGIFIGYFMYSVYNLVRCSMSIEGTYIRSQVYSGSKGVRMYSPIFQYVIQGREYQRQTSQSFRSRYIKKHFTEYKKYKIYVDKHNWNMFIVHKRIRFFDFVMVCLGILFIICPLLLG